MAPLVLALVLQSDNAVAAAKEGLLSEELKGQARYQEALSRAETGLRLLGDATPQLGPKGYRTSGGAPIAPDVYECDRSTFERLAEAPDPVEVEVCLLINAAALYLRQLQLDSARTYYEKAVQAEGERQAEIRTNLAWLEILDRRPGEATRWIGPLSPEGSSPRTYLVMGVVYRETGRPDEALPLLERAAALYEESGDDRGLARSLAHVGTLYLGASRLPEARASYERALKLAEESGDDESLWHALGGLAKCLNALGDTPGALRFYVRYLEVVSRLGASFATDQGKVSFLSNHERVLDEYFHLLVLDAKTRGRFDEARAAIESVRGRALGSLLAARGAAGRPGDLDFDRLLPFGFRSPSFSNMAAQAAPAVASRPDEPLEESPVSEVRPPPVTFLEYFSFPDMTVILVKSREGRITGATVPFGDEALRERVERFRQALRVATPRGVVVAGETAADPDDLQRDLYRILIEPIESSLPTDPDEVLAIVPHGALWYLPFAALRKDDGSLLIDAHLLTVAASEESWLFTARRARTADHRSLRAWVVGDPRMPESLFACGEEMRFDSLPGAKKEAERIAEILGADRTDLYVGRDADRLRLEAWHGAFSVLHLATHGVVCERDPLESFLVLSDLRPKDLRFDSSTSVLSIRFDLRRRDPGAGSGEPRRLHAEPFGSSHGRKSHRRVPVEGGPRLPERLPDGARSPLERGHHRVLPRVSRRRRPVAAHEPLAHRRRGEPRLDDRLLRGLRVPRQQGQGAPAGDGAYAGALPRPALLGRFQPAGTRRVAAPVDRWILRSAPGVAHRRARRSFRRPGPRAKKCPRSSRLVSRDKWPIHPNVLPPKLWLCCRRAARVVAYDSR